MAAVEKAKIKAALELFYGQNTSKNKKNETYHQFKGYKVNGRPIYTKPTLYRLMKKLDETVSLDRKKGSGRPPALNSDEVKNLKKTQKYKLLDIIRLTL